MGTVVCTLNGKRAFVRTFWLPQSRTYQLKINGLPHVEYETDSMQLAQKMALILAHGDLK